MHSLTIDHTDTGYSYTYLGIVPLGLHWYTQRVIRRFAVGVVWLSAVNTITLTQNTVEPLAVLYTGVSLIQR